MTDKMTNLEFAKAGMFTWRPVTLDDAPAIVKLYQDTDRADDTFWAGSLQEVLQDFAEPGFSPQLDTLAAITSDGQVACLVWLNPPHVSATEQFAFLWGRTHPNYRRMGLGSYALRWLEERAREKLSESGSPAPAHLRLSAPEHVAGYRALFQRLGFRHVRSSYRMRRDFSTPIPETVLPPGLRLSPWLPDRLEDIWVAYDEPFRDHWGHVDSTWEQFLHNTVESSTFRPDLSYLVLDGDIIAGISVNRVLDYENARTGLKEGWIASLGIRRPWRKRGAASALLCASMRAFQQAGYTCAGLTVDAENLTGALRIYERLGFTRGMTINTYTKQL